MASTWAVSTFPEDVTFTYNWTIDDLVKGLEREVDGAIESPSFKMPGLPWDFFLRITRTVFKYKTDPDGEITEIRYPKELQIEEAMIPITSFFGVQLYVEDPDEKVEDLKELKLAGSLSLSETDDQGVERLKLTGQFDLVKYTDGTVLLNLVEKKGRDGPSLVNGVRIGSLELKKSHTINLQIVLTTHKACIMTSTPWVILPE